MFTFKFVYENGDYTSICGARYSVCRPKTDEELAKTGVWIYPSIKAEMPVCLWLGYRGSEDEETYRELFVENQSGKTIDRLINIQPPKQMTSVKG